MPDTALVSRQVRLESLWNLLRSLAGRLWSAGLDSERLHATWRSRVDVACEACDTRLTKDELTALLDLPEGADPTAARLLRLSQGYCLNPGCSARFYRLTLAPAEGLDWNALLDAAESQQKAEACATTTEDRPANPQSSLFANRKIRIALALAVLVAVLLIRQWYVNGEIPFVTHRFKVAPAEVRPSHEAATTAPAPGPRTNRFKVAE